MSSKRFLTPVNLLNLATDPSTALEGDIYYNTAEDLVKVFSNSAWIPVGNTNSSQTTVDETAPTNPELGDSWYVASTGSFYIWDGTFWVEVNGVVSGTNNFNTIAVEGQTDIVADSAGDTLTFVAGSNISITTDPTTDAITINATADPLNSILYPDYITFDTTPETSNAEVGTMFWDSGDGVIKVTLENNVELGLGQEEVVKVKNATGSSIAKGKVVYINGAAGQRPTIALSDADAESTSSKTLGLTAQAIADGAEGFVTTFGVLRGVNTGGLTEGAALWLSSTAGSYTTTLPVQPQHMVFIGYVIKAHSTAGEIFVNPQNGYELHELHNVLIEAYSSVTDNEVLAYDTTSGLWKNQTAPEAGLIDTSSTAQTKDGDLTLNGTLTANTLDLNEAKLTAEGNTIAVNTPILIDSFDGTLYRSAEYLLQLSQLNNFITSKILIIHNGTNVSLTEYGTVSIGLDIPYDLSCSFSGNNLELSLQCSTATTDQVTFKYSKTLFDV